HPPGAKAKIADETKSDGDDATVASLQDARVASFPCVGSCASDATVASLYDTQARPCGQGHHHHHHHGGDLCRSRPTPGRRPGAGRRPPSSSRASKTSSMRWRWTIPFVKRRTGARSSWTASVRTAILLG